MNIFVTSKCPVECAKNLDTKRVIKMILETGQMLSTAINENGGNAPYKSTHKHHPANVWARTSRSNFEWLHDHFIALCLEYTKRRGKVHKTQSIADDLWNLRHHIPEGAQTPFVNCAANAEKGCNYKHISDVHEAYRMYLCDRWESDKFEPKWD